MSSENMSVRGLWSNQESNPLTESAIHQTRPHLPCKYRKITLQVSFQLGLSCLLFFFLLSIDIIYVWVLAFRFFVWMPSATLEYFQEKGDLLWKAFKESMHKETPLCTSQPVLCSFCGATAVTGFLRQLYPFFNRVNRQSSFN